MEKIIIGWIIVGILTILLIGCLCMAIISETKQGRNIWTLIHVILFWADCIIVWNLGKIHAKRKNLID